MNEHIVPDTAEQLGHAVFRLMTELTHVMSQSDSSPEEIESAEQRLWSMHLEIYDGLWHDPDIAHYELGLRSAMMTHLSVCASRQRDRVTVHLPLQPDAVQDLKIRAQASRAGLDGLGHLGPEVRDAVAEVYEAHARLGEMLRNCDEPPLLILRDLQAESP